MPHQESSMPVLWMNAKQGLQPFGFMVCYADEDLAL
jgi:hypothetical protein